MGRAGSKELAHHILSPLELAREPWIQCAENRKPQATNISEHQTQQNYQPTEPDLLLLLLRQAVNRWDVPPATRNTSLILNQSCVLIKSTATLQGLISRPSAVLEVRIIHRSPSP